jgi:RHS repeat-associated protein
LPELSNHLGNVLSVISDKKVGVTSDNTTVDYYVAEVLSQTDYYPFGMTMPGRSYQSDKYRYLFNGKEQDPEVKGEGAQYDYGFRIYDPRLGRFLSTDPLAKSYPWNSPYSYAEGDVIRAIDSRRCWYAAWL